MTNEKLIHDLRQLGKYSEFKPNYFLISADRIEELSEKQIPKKVKSIDENHSYYVCGNCDTAIYYSDMPKSHKYCLNCGQALDWEDAE